MRTYTKSYLSIYTYSIDLSIDLSLYPSIHLSIHLTIDLALYIYIISLRPAGLLRTKSCGVLPSGAQVEEVGGRLMAGRAFGVQGLGIGFRV